VTAGSPLSGLAGRLTRARQGTALVAQRTAGPEPRFDEFDDEPAEARSVARHAAG